MEVNIKNILSVVKSLYQKVLCLEEDKEYRDANPINTCDCVPIFPCLISEGSLGIYKSVLDYSLITVYTYRDNVYDPILFSVERIQYKGLDILLDRMYILGESPPGEDFLILDANEVNALKIELINKLDTLYNETVTIEISMLENNTRLLYVMHGLSFPADTAEGIGLILTIQGSGINAVGNGGRHVVETEGIIGVQITHNGTEYTDGTDTFKTIKDIKVKYPGVKVC